MPDVHEFLSDLASANPVPGGGSVAAYQVAMAAALVSMVCNLTIGRKRYHDVEEQVVAIKEQAVLLLDRAEQLAEEDSDAYRRVASAMASPRATDGEKIARRERVQAALKDAAGPPLRSMQAATDVLRLAEQLVAIGNSSAVSDVGTAALTARSAFYAARLNVYINMAGVQDEDWIQKTEEMLRRMPVPDQLEEEVVRVTDGVIRGHFA